MQGVLVDLARAASSSMSEKNQPIIQTSLAQEIEIKIEIARRRGILQVAMQEGARGSMGKLTAGQGRSVTRRGKENTAGISGHQRDAISPMTSAECSFMKETQIEIQKTRRARAGPRRGGGKESKNRL